MAGPFCSKALAIARRQRFLSAVDREASSRDAALASAARRVISTRRLMRVEAKLNGETEKEEIGVERAGEVGCKLWGAVGVVEKEDKNAG